MLLIEPGCELRTTILKGPRPLAGMSSKTPPCLPPPLTYSTPVVLSLSDAAATPTRKLLLLLLPNCDFAAVINHNVNIHFLALLGETPVKWLFGPSPQRGLDPQVDNYCPTPTRHQIIFRTISQEVGVEPRLRLGPGICTDDPLRSPSGRRDTAPASRLSTHNLSSAALTACSLVR